MSRRRLLNNQSSQIPPWALPWITEYWHAPYGVTGALNASAWAPLKGTHSFSQATGANQPIVLPFTGARYLYLPGIASNNCSAPNKSITGNLTLIWKGRLNDWTPTGGGTLLFKLSGNDGFVLQIQPTGVPRLRIGNGTTVTNIDAAAGPGWTDDTEHELKVVWQDGVGATYYYDGVQSGSQVAAAVTLTNAAVAMVIGPTASTGSKVTNASITNSASTTYYSVDFTQATEGSTSFAQNGDTWTVGQSGGVPAQIVGSASLLFDGAADFMKTAAFTLNQPVTYFLLLKQISWTAFDVILDGNTNSSNLIYQLTESPKLGMAAGTALQESGGLAVGTYGIVSAVFNGASSSIQINNGAADSGAAGASNAGAITLGTVGNTVDNFGNFQLKAFAYANTALTALQRTQTIRAMARQYGIGL